MNCYILIYRIRSERLIGVQYVFIQRMKTERNAVLMHVESISNHTCREFKGLLTKERLSRVSKD